jgi:flavin-dependent dehydrogenase
MLTDLYALFSMNKWSDHMSVYDVIIVGARCAGAPTAMLLARKGYKVLLLDKAIFPSDTISTHIIFAPGIARLKQWGLLDKVLATQCPLIERMVFDPGPFRLSWTPTPYDGIRYTIAPRRISLDKILLDAAIEAGVEMREGCTVEDLLMEGDQVTGVRCHTKGGGTAHEKARIVVGADGRNSIIARMVNAQSYNTIPSMTCWYYSYWSGVDIKDLEFYTPPGRGIGFIPTNDGLVCVPMIWPHDQFNVCRSDIEGNYLKTLQLVPGIAEIMHNAKREDRFYGMAELPMFFRKSYGLGWALVGDAGYHKDPITGQGIGDAFKGAEALTEAIDAGFSGRQGIDEALEQYVQKRDEKAMPMYGLTNEWAKLQPPPPEMQQIMMALQHNQEQTDRFVGAVAGVVPLPEFFSPENISQILEYNSQMI